MLRVPLLSFVFAALVIMASSFHGKWLTTINFNLTNHVRSFFLIALIIVVLAFNVTNQLTTITFKYNQTFFMGDPNSDPLDDCTKWDLIPSLPGCAGSSKLCRVLVTNVPGQDIPSEQNILDHIRKQYDSNGDTFSPTEVVKIFVGRTKVAEAVVKLHN